jgi:hypothetical protein
MHGTRLRALGDLLALGEDVGGPARDGYRLGAVDPVPAAALRLVQGLVRDPQDSDAFEQEAVVPREDLARRVPGAAA